jgi:hypothetical protein
VCLLAAHLSSAAPAFRLDESRIKLSLDGERAVVRLEVENGTGRDLPARLGVELLDPRDRVRANASADVRLRRGANALDLALELPYAQLLEAERREFPWYRLRYVVAPAPANPAAPALEGVVSVSEATPDLFGLSVISAPAARPGSHYVARVRAANPVTGRPSKGVAVEAAMTFEGVGDKKTVLRAKGATDGDGFVTLGFDLPRTLHASDDEAGLKVTARRGAFVEEAETDVSVNEEPRALLTTDKPLYQPGQTVHMRALVFDQNGRALAGEEVGFKVEDEEGSTAFTTTLNTSRFGVAAADWRVPESTRLGTYTVKLEVDDRYDIDFGGVTGFRVSRYDLPNFSVTTKPDRPYYLKDESPSVEVRADYLFGQPVRRGRVRVVRQTERRWNYREQKYETEERPAVEGDLQEGLFLARLDLKEEHEGLAESGYERFRDLDFVAYVTDPTTNRTEQRRFQLRLTKDPVHVYVTEGRYRQAKGLPLAFHLSTFYADGTPAECDVTLYEEGAAERRLGADGRVHEVKEAGRALASVRTNRYGVAKVLGPPVSRGETRENLPLRFVARDRSGRAGHHSDDFWLRYYRPQAPEIRVETDKSVYAPGEPVRVEIVSEAERMSVAVDAVSEGRVLYSGSARISGGRAALVIPTGADFAGAVTVTAAGLAPAQDAADDDSYSVGARTVVFPRDRELKLDVRLSQKSFRPGEEAGAQFAVRTADGRRAAGALGVVVFDKAVEERARTDGEASRGFGFGGPFLDYFYGYWNVAGVTRRDVERLDPSRPRPEGFDAVAEMLYNNERPYDLRRVTTGTDFEREQSRVFADLVAARLKPVKDALDARHATADEYPSDERGLVRTLAQAGVDFASVTDPWGRPFRPRFSVARVNDRLELLSGGADERPDTDDDFVAASFSWPYFRKTGRAIDRAAAEYHGRTGGHVRDLATLLAELRRGGIEADALRDRWGQPYRFHFETFGTYYVINVESSGPDRVFAPQRGRHSSDDFDVWRLATDYFEGSRKALDAALEKYAREGRAFPRTREELAAALSKSSLSLEALRDGWGRPVYALFSTDAWFTDRVEVAAGGAAGAKRSTRPVTQTVRVLSLRSAGPDGREGTADDFTLASHTSVGTEQTAQDATPAPAPPGTTFSSGTGAITGTVTDPTGAVIPNATVVARHSFTQFEASATTNDEGAYLLRNLPSGLYTVTVSAPYFLPFTVEAVRVISSNLTKLDAALQVGATAETVTVMAESPTVQMTSMQLLESKAVVTRGPALRAPLSTPRLREFFPETLVWSPELETAGDGTARLNFKLADNITTWKMSVIASTEDGRLGTAEAELLSFQPFFVEHDPPRVLTEGDEISLPVVLRNYLARPQGVDVEMKPEGWFALAGAARKRADVPAGDAARPTFDFRAVAPVTDGKQRVTALGADASDAIEKPVTVHPDGEERSATDGTILTDSGALAVNVPADAVRGSLRGELKVYPNLAAHVLEGVEAIMSRPYGCGEQTISSAYPSVLVLDYHAKLKGEGAEPAVVGRARKYAQVGHERLLGYRAPGGGFTYWGRGEPDLALTAYALRFLTDASRVIETDADVIRETREWLLRKQRADGSWPAHTWNGSEDGLRTALTTAFIARVLAATQKFGRDERGPVAQASPAQAPPTRTAPAGIVEKKEQPTPPLKRALAYLAARADEADEPYLIASLALAASDADEPALAARAAKRLRALAIQEGTGVYWALETNTPFYGWGLAGRVETTALAVQALNRYCGRPSADCGPDDKLVERGLDFLLRKKDRYGVWYSTQATVNVFDALLSAVAARGAGAGAQGEDVAEVFVNGRGAGRLALPPPDRLSGPLLLDLTPFLGAGGNRVELRRRARATPAQAHLVTTFYVPWGARAEVEPEGGGAQRRGNASTLKLSVNYDRTQAGITQEVTCNVSAERVGHGGYGMLLAEVGLPPGADVDRASLERAVAESGWALNSYDVLPDRLVVYLWPRGGGTSFRFKFRPRYGLNALTAPSQLYDYYNPEARTVVPPTRFVVR